MTDPQVSAPPVAASPGEAEESRARVASMPSQMREVALRAIDKGLIDPARFGVSKTSVDPGAALEAVDNPVGLEAIVLMAGRPPLKVKNDAVVLDAIALNAMGPGTDLVGFDTAAVKRVEPFLPSIGRIEFINHRMQWGGTGFVIEGGIGNRRRVVTNRHVAKLVAKRRADGSGVFLRSPAGALFGARIDMREEFDSLPGHTFECPVERIVYLADDSEADCALLEIVVTDTCQPGTIPFAAQRAAVGELVAAIGYPAYDDRNDLAAMRNYFGELYNVKRFAPGLIQQSAPGQLLMHDCTTLGGNSGSAVISLTQKAIVGLHFSGTFGVGNSAVSVETLKQLATGRLHTVVSPQGLAARGEGVEAPDGEHAADHFVGREGYRPDFLGAGLEVSLPTLSEAVRDDLATPSDATEERPHELRYTHFGVFFSAGRRSPRFTAVNIDGAGAVRIKRQTPDRWFFDLRIPRALQLGQGYYEGDLDRGHMVRRQDPNWGPDAQRANDDSFHYPNAALQHSLLNRGKTLWQGLENYILDSAQTRGFRASVFTGPIFGDEDPELGRGGVLIPLEYWKIVVMPATGGGLHATGYLLSQGDLIRRFLEDPIRPHPGGNEAPVEGFELGAYRTFQIAIRDLEKGTGLSWPGLAGADPLERSGNEAVSAVTYAPLETLADIFL
jgi:endonuclease G